MSGSVVRLPDELRDEIIEHCLSSLPNEGCGMLALDGGQIVKIYRTGNQDSSPSSYTVPPQEHYDALIDAEGRGWVLEGVFHSHPDGPAAMSATDISRLTDERWVYLVVGLAGAVPEIAGWRDGESVRLVSQSSRPTAPPEAGGSI